MKQGSMRRVKWVVFVWTARSLGKIVNNCLRRRRCRCLRTQLIIQGAMYMLTSSLKFKGAIYMLMSSLKFQGARVRVVGRRCPRLGMCLRRRARVYEDVQSSSYEPLDCTKFCSHVVSIKYTAHTNRITPVKPSVFGLGPPCTRNQVLKLSPDHCNLQLYRILGDILVRRAFLNDIPSLHCVDAADVVVSMLMSNRR